MQDNYSPKIEQQARQAWLEQDIDRTTTIPTTPPTTAINVSPPVRMHMGHGPIRYWRRYKPV